MSGEMVPWPAGEARWLTEVEVAWETERRRFCDAACPEVVLVEIVTWLPGRTESRRVRHLYCERHAMRAAGLGGINVPPRRAGY